MLFGNINKKIKKAIINKDNDTLEKLLSRKVDFRKFTYDIGNILYLAASNDNPEAMELLLNNGVDLTDPMYEATVELAANAGEISVLRNFVKIGYNFTDTNCNVLHYAASGNQIEVMEFLVKIGCDINQSKFLYESDRKSQITPLMEAARFRSTEAINYLINKEAETAITNQRGLRASDLYRTTNESELFNTEVYELLLEVEGTNESDIYKKLKSMKFPAETITYLEKCTDFEHVCDGDAEKFILSKIKQIRFGTFEHESELNPVRYYIDVVDLTYNGIPDFMIGLLIWVPKLELFGTYDGEHGHILLFTESKWEDIIKNPCKYLEGQWEYENKQQSNKFVDFEEFIVNKKLESFFEKEEIEL